MWKNYCIINFRARWVSHIIPAIAIILALASLSLFIKNHSILVGDLDGLQDVISTEASKEKSPQTALCFAILESIGSNHSVGKNSHCSWANLKRTLS
jgi:uncharacterized YccA/Bax inhibitor family protein